ncbi:uncharacterized protein LAESUDRAFT_710295 [Laetiporus sulphureus 93-53]|uniref:Uncharacterized protein n=1 Tax=Laetiporus sulphureus 93-53 TaxID=1314785 RepID=A0A165IM44_9APHY|nr:uncharacterized protein LAESUDRAFT_710295 [Laetiporus sulphureus 93-53]KZT13271.1 hypothetical protein LAESUDRAFT_710295 [Laetiporus sulphureus 93-53]
MTSQSPQRNRVPTMQGRAHVQDRITASDDALAIHLKIWAVGIYVESMVKCAGVERDNASPPCSLHDRSNSNTTPRDSTPSPSLRERQRAIKAHSLPVVPSVSQILSNQNQQPIYAQGQQPSPTTSNSSLQSRRSPPPTSRISPTTGKMSVATHPRERSPDRISTPPALVHSHSQPVLPQLIPLPPPGPQHALSQPNVLPPTAQNPFHPRPIPRGPPPPFLTQYQGTEEQWQMTEQLMAEIERADLQQTQGQFSHPAGTSGVAYAGGAASNGLGIHLLNTMNPSAKDPAVERVRGSDRASPKEQDAKRQKDAQPARESPKTRDRSQTMSSLEGHPSTTRTPEYRGSPQYQTPMASPGERTAAYGQYIQEGREHGASKLRYSQGGENTARRVKPPPRVDSTQPRETSPEMSSESGEETAGEERFVDHYVGEAEAAAAVENGTWTNGNGNGNGKAQGGDDDGEWVDEEDEFEEEDLLDLEYHPTYVSNPQKRRRRFDVRWEALKQTFQALDRETDSTLILLASPPHSSKLHSLTSRSIRRDAGLRNSPKLTAMRKSFNTIAIQRRNARSERISLVERLLLSSGSASSADGSPGSEAREGDLRRALDAALGSLEEMGRIHDLREARWRTEMRQISEERDRVEMLLRQTLGPVIANGRQ